MKANSNSLIEKGIDAFRSFLSPNKNENSQKSLDNREQNSSNSDDKPDEHNSELHGDSTFGREPTITSMTSDSGSVQNDETNFHEMKFLELKAALRKKGIKFKRTDTKEILLKMLLNAPSENVYDTTPAPSETSEIYSHFSVQSTPSAARLKAARKSTVSNYGLRSSDVHNHLRSHDSVATPMSKAFGKDANMTRHSTAKDGIVGHNIDDDYVHFDVLSNFHEKRSPHHRRKSGSAESHSHSSTIVSSDEQAADLNSHQKGKSDLSVAVDKENEGHPQSADSVDETAFESQMAAAEEMLDADESVAAPTNVSNGDVNLPVIMECDQEPDLHNQPTDDHSAENSQQSDVDDDVQLQDDTHIIEVQSSSDDESDQEDEGEEGSVAESDTPFAAADNDMEGGQEMVEDEEQQQQNEVPEVNDDFGQESLDVSGDYYSAEENGNEDEEEDNASGGGEGSSEGEDEGDANEQEQGDDSTASDSEQEAEVVEIVDSASDVDSGSQSGESEEEDQQQQPNTIASSSDNESEEVESVAAGSDVEDGNENVVEEEDEEEDREDSGEGSDEEDEDESEGGDEGEEDDESVVSGSGGDSEEMDEDISEDGESVVDSGDSQYSGDESGSEQASSDDDEFPFPPPYASPGEVVDLVSSDEDEDEVLNTTPTTAHITTAIATVSATPQKAAVSSEPAAVTKTPVSNVQPTTETTTTTPSTTKTSTVELNSTAKAALSAFSKLGNSFTALITAPVSDNAAKPSLSVAEYELLRALLERNKPVEAEQVVAAVAPVREEEPPVVMVSVPQSKRKTVSFPDDDDYPVSVTAAAAAAPAKSTTPLLVTSQVKPKSLSFAAHEAVTIPPQPQTPLWNSRDSFLPSPPLSAGAKAAPVVTALKSNVSEPLSGIAQGSRRLMSTPFNKGKAIAAPQSVDVNLFRDDENVPGSGNILRRLPTPYHSRQKVPQDDEDEGDKNLAKEQDDADNDYLRLISGEVSLKDQHKDKKRSFFDTDTARDSFGNGSSGVRGDRDSFGGESTLQIDSSSYLDSLSSAHKRRSIDSTQYRLSNTPLGATSQRLSSNVNAVGTPFRMSESPFVFPSLAGSGVTSPSPVTLSAAPQGTASLSFHMGSTASSSRIPVAGSSRSSYIPKFQSSSARFSTFQAPTESATASRKGAASPAVSLSYIQRRRLQRQSEGVASAVVAKKILETLGNITTNVEQERKRPLALTWQDGSKSAIKDKDENEDERRRGPPSKAAAIGNISDISSTSKSIAIVHSTPVAPQIAIPEKTVASSNVSDATKPVSTIQPGAAKAAFASRIPVFGGPAVKAQSQSSTTASTSVVSVKNDNATSVSTASFTPKTVPQQIDQEFVFVEPMDVSGVERVSESILGKRAGDATSIKYAFSPPRHHRKSKLSEASSLVTVTKSVTAVKNAAESVVVEAPTKNIWDSKSINDGVKCPTCLSKNKAGATKCASCESVIGTVSSVAPSLATANAAMSTNNIWAASSLSEGAKCPTCLSKNKKDAVKCASCEGPMGSSTSIAATASTSTSKPATTTVSSGGFTFGVPASTSTTTTSTAQPVSTSGFTFGASTSTPVSAEVVAPSVAIKSSPFTFGVAPSESGSKASVVAEKGGFTFGAPPPVTEVSTASVSTKSGFSFGGSTEPTTTQAVVSTEKKELSFGSASDAATPLAATGFSFGAAPTIPSSTVLPGFGTTSVVKSDMPSTTPPVTFSGFGVAPVASAGIAPFSLPVNSSMKTSTSFGAAFDSTGSGSGEDQQQSKKRASISWGDDVKPASAVSTGFSFGATPSTPVVTPAPAPQSFGIGGDNKSTLAFGGFAPATVDQPAQTTESSKPAFTFGASSPAVSATPSFGASLAEPSKPFMFGGGVTSVPTQPATVSAKPVVPLSTFGALSSIPEDKAVSAPVTASTPATFTGFGAPSFGGFGKSESSGSLSGLPDKTVSAPFTFGAGTSGTAVSAPSTSPFLFGSTAPVAAVAPPSNSSGTFMFGSSAPAVSATIAPASSNFAFGATSQAAAAPMFAGGSNNAATPMSGFGATSTVASAPMFGGFGAPSAVAGPFGNVASATTAPPMNSNPFSSSFGQQPINNSGGFGQQPTSASSTPSFGFMSGGMQPAFGSSSQLQSGPFNGQQQQQQSGGTMFGAPQSSGFGVNPSPVNFGGGPFGGGNSGSNTNLAGMSGGSTGFSLGATDKSQSAGAAGARRKVKVKRPGT